MQSVHESQIHRELSASVVNPESSPDGASSQEGALSIEKLAEQLHARGMSSAAIFFLEMSKPLAGLIQAGCVGIEPLWTMCWGTRGIQELRWLTDDRARIEELIQAIEERFHGR